MDFNFDGLPEPIRLPDEHLPLRQFELFQRFALATKGKPEDPRTMRECLAAVLNDPELVARTDALPMNPRNVAEWNRLAGHLGMLITGGKPDPLVKPGKRPRKAKRSANSRSPSATS